MSSRRPRSRTGRSRPGTAVMVVLLGFALVLMHHVVGAAPEAGARPADSTHAHSNHAHSIGAQGADGHAAADASAGTGGTGSPHGDHGSMLLHLCLAVLVALGAVVLSLLGGTRGRRYDDGNTTEPVADLTVAPVPRPPPLAVRLACLQVLRR